MPVNSLDYWFYLQVGTLDGTSIYTTIIGALVTFCASSKPSLAKLDAGVDDIGLRFEVGVEQQLRVRAFTQPDVTLSANVPELILVAAGKEDPDTLFFQRKLRIEGDTELGLEVKNLLLSIELDSLPKPARIGIEQLAKVLQTLTASE